MKHSTRMAKPPTIFHHNYLPTPFYFIEERVREESVCPVSVYNLAVVIRFMTTNEKNLPAVGRELCSHDDGTRAI